MTPQSLLHPPGHLCFVPHLFHPAQAVVTHGLGQTALGEKGAEFLMSWTIVKARWGIQAKYHLEMKMHFSNYWNRMSSGVSV